MNRASNDLRRIFLRQRKLGKSIIEISQLIGISRQSLWYWTKMTEEELLKVVKINTRTPSIDEDKFKQYYIDNPLSFDWEASLVFNVSKTTIQRWRDKLKITRKVTTKTYKESKPELKKTL